MSSCRWCGKDVRRCLSTSGTTVQVEVEPHHMGGTVVLLTTLPPLLNGPFVLIDRVSQLGMALQQEAPGMLRYLRHSCPEEPVKKPRWVIGGQR
jgi:hypothetical protein